MLFVALLLIAPPPAPSLSVFREALAAAKPGDRVLLAPGEYEGSIFIKGLRGEEGRPIIIGGADPANPPVVRGGGECIHLASPAFVIIENLHLRGASANGINIDDGGDLGRPAPGITLRHLRISDIGSGGNQDGIKLSGLTGFTVEDCRIENWGGSGIDMVGCRGGVIRGCTLEDTDSGAANGIQAKGGSKQITIESCRFVHAGQRALNIGGSTGLAYFRPGPEGFEARDITVRGCTIVGSLAAVAFVGVDGATFSFNTIYRPGRWAVRILQETREPGFVPCRRGVFTDNIVVFSAGGGARAINIGDGTDAASFAFERNIWFDPASAAPPVLPSIEKGGVSGVDPGLADPEAGDFTPSAEGPAGRAGAGVFKRE